MKDFSGCVRIKRLNAQLLAGQEMHGKRLDNSSQNRKISDEPPVTTTGLDLTELLKKHEAGARRQAGTRYQAMHMLIQFPKALVDQDDPKRMLDHARSFAESVFGPEAVFADRVDLDEQNRHVVDLFVAPKYTKKTKCSEATWISLSRDLKALAKKRGELNKSGEPNLRAQGRALQSEFHDYLIERMGLHEAVRGNAKLYSWADWKTPEEMKAKALAEQLAERVLEDIRAITKEAPDLFVPHPERKGDVRLAGDEEEGRAVELTTLVDVNAFFKIGAASFFAGKDAEVAATLKAKAEEDRRAAAAARLEVEQQLEASETDRETAAELRRNAAHEGQAAGYRTGLMQGRVAAARELEEQREKINEAKKQTEAEAANARAEREKAAQAASQAAIKLLEAENDRKAARAAKDAAEALKADWDAKIAAGHREIERQTAELAKERGDLERGRAKLAADRNALDEDATHLKADHDQLASDRAGLDKSKNYVAAVTAGIDAWVEMKIVDVSEPGEEKTFHFGSDVLPSERAGIEARIEPAFEAVWGLVNRAKQKIFELVRERELKANLREAAAAESLRQLDEASRARVAPEVIKQILEAPAAAMSHEEFMAAQAALAKLRGQGR